MTSLERCGAILTIDLDAIVANWRLLRELAAPARIAAVVKADGYGLGIAQVAPALARAGCHSFFVAHIEEGIALRALLPEAIIHVLHGCPPGCEADAVEHRLIPVLNGLADVTAWAAHARRLARALPADLHVDTGMSRLGLPEEELRRLAADPSLLQGVALSHVMSHLACAEQPEHPLNHEQRLAFVEALGLLPAAPACLANSAGIFLGPQYHFQRVRPGIALWGGNPRPGSPNPMGQVVRLQGKILQVRDVDSSRSVGYGATWRPSRPTRIATVAVGYADGYPRSLSNAGGASIGAARIPVVGRVSMDLITLDVSNVPESLARPGGRVDLIGPEEPIDAVAGRAGTISYEILTALGRRYHRVYVGGEA